MTLSKNLNKQKALYELDVLVETLLIAPYVTLSKVSDSKFDALRKSHADLSKIVFNLLDNHIISRKEQRELLNNLDSQYNKIKNYLTNVQNTQKLF